MRRRFAARGIVSGQLAGVLLCLVATILSAGCSSEEPTAPGRTYSLSGRVRLTGYLVDANGRYAGLRDVDDADGVEVELRYGENWSRFARTVDGVYWFGGLAPGQYRVRARVIGELADETNPLTIVSADLFSGDTLRLKSIGDILPIPNPGSDYFDLFFAIPDTQHVDMRVRDLPGNTTQVIVSKIMEPGLQRVYWNGRDGNGQLVRGSLYWVTLETGTDKRAHLLFKQ